MMTPRLATTIMFVVNGTIIGTWIASLPAIQVSLGASATEIGLALLCGAAGSLVAMPLTGQLLTRVSSRRLLVITSLVFPLLAPAPLLAPSPILLAAVMLAFGAANGAMDVSMNAHGVALERASPRSIFSSLHAGWSIGGILGALGVGAAAMLGAPPAAEAVAIGAAAWVVALLAGRSLGRGSVATEGAARISLPSRAVLPIGLLAVTAAFVEGGLADWAGIYLRSGVGTAAEVAALGYAAFSLGMTAGRLSGDAVKERIGSIRMLQGGMVLVAASVSVTLLVGDAVVALLGLAIAGLGVANAIPQLFGAAGRIPPEGPSLSAVFTMAYTAFLLGPPIIGVAADATGLTLALGLTVVAALLVAATATRVPAAETNPRFARGAEGQVPGAPLGASPDP
jgi:MFS family permease